MNDFTRDFIVEQLRADLNENLFRVELVRRTSIKTDTFVTYMRARDLMLARDQIDVALESFRRAGGDAHES
jgi:hypothetical protein